MKPTITFLTALLLAPLAVLHAQQERAATMKNAFIINEDNSHFYSSRPAEDMTLKGLNAFVDQYAGTAVTHLFLCPNAMRASFRSRGDRFHSSGIPVGGLSERRSIRSSPGT